MKSSGLRVFLSAGLLALILGVPGFGQTITGAITGRTSDASGALIPGVEVTISSPSMIGGTRTSVTDESGSYRFTQLAIGIYRVSFALPGFKTINIEGVNVLASQTQTVNQIMEVSSVSEEVTVTSTAPTIDLEATTVGVNWDAQKFDNLPTGRGVRAFTQLIPGLYSTSYDVGGNTLGGPAGVGARVYGKSGGSLMQYDGVVWDQTFGDYGTYEQVQVSAAAKGAEAQNPGATVSFVVKSGSNDFHGTVFGGYENKSFGSNNIDQKLLDKGYAQGAGGFTRYVDYSAEVGGRIFRDKLWFYSAFSHSYVGNLIPGFVDLQKNGEQVINFIRLDNPTLKLTYQMTKNMKLETTTQWNRKWQPYRGGSQFVPREATQNQISWSGIGPGLNWTYIMNPKMTLDLGVNRSGYFWPDTAWSTDIRKRDITTGHIRGPFVQVYRRPIRWQRSGNFSWFTDVGGKNNELKTGFLGYWFKTLTHNLGYPTSHQQVYRYRSTAAQAAAGQYFLNPDSTEVYDYPTFVASGVNYNSWYVNDKLTWNRKLTFNLGLRVDRYSSFLPEQGNPGTGPWATKSITPDRRDFPVYQAWSPRISFIYDFTGQGTVALKGSYGKYTGGGSGNSASSGPVAGSVNTNAIITRTYSNWDGTIPYIPRAQDLVSTSGGGGIQRLDKGLKPAWTDEYTLGLEVALTHDYTVRLNAVRKMDYGGSKELDLAQPFSAYTDVQSGIDRGRDNVIGTADDKVVYVWSVPRSYPTFGRIDRLTVNVRENEGNALYTAYETTFSKNYSNGWSLLAGYTANFVKISNKDPLTPNDMYYNLQAPYWDYSLKLNGQYNLPFGLMYAATYQAQIGQFYERTVQVRNALNSTVNLNVEAQAGRYPWVRLWDNRISKTFTVGDGHEFEMMFDLFNTMNTNAITAQGTINGPNYGKPTAIIPPRIFRLSGRWRF